MRYPEEEGLDYDDTLDPETQPDPYFDGMSVVDVWGELDRLEREYYEQEMLDLMRYEEERMWMEENRWFRD